MHSLRKMRIVSYVLLCLMLVIVFSVSCFRQFYGVEITDEGLYAADAYFVAKGATPFADNWFLSSGSSLLSSVFLKAYLFIVGGTEGIYLFTRIMYLVIKALVCALVALLMRRYLAGSAPIFFVLPFFVLSPFSLSTMSYNTWPHMLFFMGNALLFVASGAERNRALLAAFCAGVVMALTAVSNPTFALGCVAAALPLLFFSPRGERLLRFFAYAGMGVLSIALLFLLLSARVGGVERFLEGFSAMMQQSSLSLYLDKPNLAEHQQLLIEAMRGIEDLLLFVAAFFVLLYLLRAFLWREKNKLGLRRIYLSAMLLGCLLCVIQFMVQYSQSMAAMENPITALFFLVPPLLLPALGVKWKIGLRMLCCFWLPLVALILSYIFLTIAPINARWYLLLQGAILTIAFFIMGFSDTASVQGSAWDTRVFRGLTYLLSLCMCVFFFLSHYALIYRDATIQNLTYRMEQGVFKGLYTQPERGEALIHLELEIRRLTDAEDHVLFLDLAPAAYMMTDAQACAPSSWDLMSYTYGSNDDAVLHDYFRITGQLPTKIIYIDSEKRDPHLSIDHPGYRFNDYVNENYYCAYRSDKDRFGLRMYVRNPQDSGP